uniref:Uncharacterized protein n=1 Tax=Tetranychus urticae TaxID=32264 RepID=T1JU31_TETUR
MTIRIDRWLYLDTGSLYATLFSYYFHIIQLSNQIQQSDTVISGWPNTLADLAVTATITTAKVHILVSISLILKDGEL